MTEPSVFSDDPNFSLFEQSSRQNGETHWLASDLMRFLGYENSGVFRSAITKAQMACLQLDIPVEENFIAISGDSGNQDTKLTRFACYLVAMNADVKKQEVARAQAYFVSIAESVRRYHEESENVLRVQLRGEIKQREVSLSGVAKRAQVTEYAFFQNAGYRGMYNMNLKQLKSTRSIPSDRSPLDFMGKVELAANLFRITQTEERIKNEGIVGQDRCETAAEYVGKEVRATMKKASGTTPESLPLADDVNVVKREIKQTAKKLKRIDRSNKKQ